ncbi:hypothetical protein Dda_1029 [Drechslerella dactyloides]|uniref:ATP-dependent bile acid permease n=1 Tax=Drechslerella dactyloides TaxID=74499 RepID=A0AAD6J695_DREDA|nr:hypothetical protein Dda_1029 [Drechslerella dactyloides]
MLANCDFSTAFQPRYPGANHLTKTLRQHRNSPSLLTPSNSLLPAGLLERHRLPTMQRAYGNQFFVASTLAGNGEHERFLHCRSPLWEIDNFTTCFRKDYLQVLLPIAVVSTSLLFIIIGSARVYYRKWQEHHQRRFARRGSAYRDDDNASDASSDSSAELLGSDSENDFDTGDEDHLALTRRMSLASVQETKVDRPVGELWWVTLEELAVMAQVGLHLAQFYRPTNSDWRYGKLPAIAGVIVWKGYTLILTTLRITFHRTKRYPLPVLWDHTAAIYLSNFLLYIVTFRTVLINDRPSLDRAIVIAEFSLVSFLAVIVLTTRRGNKPVKQEIIDGLEPSHEPLASLFSLASYSWIDPLIWDGFKTPLVLKRVWNLPRDDLAIVVLNSFRQTKKTAALSWRLMKFFKGLLFLQFAWTIFYSFLTFAPTMLLRAILEYTDNPDKYPRNVAWLYVCLLFVTGLVQTTGSGLALFIGRRICIRLRAIIIGEIYSKALRRKASAAERALGQKGEEDEKKKKSEKDKKSKKKKKGADEEQASPKKEEEAKDDSQANVGAIINLMAVDSFKVADICAYLHFLVAATPVQLTVAIVLLYQVLGWSSVAGIGVMVGLFPINYMLSREFGRIQNRIMTITDKRIQTTNEAFQNVRIIKYFAWEQRYEGVIAEPRALELRQLRNRYILWGFSASLWYSTPVIITFISFWLYTGVEKKELRAPVAFTALSLFAVMRTPLDQFADMITNVLQSKVSIDRVQEFLDEEETEKYQQLKPAVNNFDEGAPIIGFRDGHFSWGSKSSLNKPDEPSSFQLLNLNVSFVPGHLNVIAGQTGSGKTSLLMALLGEMTHIKGSVYLPGYHCREDLYQDENGHTESVAYCAQQAWLVNDTIKNNIIFASKYDEERYRAVLFACSLERDLEILDKGDATEVGEKGISLSGGQKQRISLARALYSNAKHVLLDDCLSAVDSHTAKWIYEYCIMGSLMQYRTCILVTHNVSLCVPRAKMVVVMKGGEIIKQGTPEEVVASGALGKDEMLKGLSNSRSQSTVASRVGSTANLNKDAVVIGENGAVTADGQVKSLVTTNGTAKADDAKQKKADEASENEESKSEGAVDWGVYKLYLGMMGGWFFWFMLITSILLQQVGSLATSVWIRQWALQYQTEDTNVLASSHHHSPASRLGSFGTSNFCSASGICAWSMPIASEAANISIASEGPSEPQKVNVMYYLTVYALFGLLYSVTSLFREGIVFAGSLRASRRMHDKLLHRILRAKFRFFDSTPLGRIMNRFSKDLEAVDQEVAPIALGMVHSLASVITIVVLISVITPGFLLAGVVITGLYWIIGMFYLRASRDLKRLEAVQRSPLYQHFGETLAGITTIRAYGDERRFVRDNLAKIDSHNRPFFYLWVANRWLAWRMDVAGSLVAFFAGVFVILSIGKIDAGLAGLSLSYAISFNDNVLWVVRLYAMVEQNMNSIERLKEYLEIEQEAKEVIPDNRPSADWPSKGAIHFEEYSTRYRSDLDLVLKKVSFDVKPCEKVGIVGRTGAGKSSLALALFRALEAEEGKIVIDGIDISKIGLKDLRDGITMVPQDPTLFSGTIRSNLDPFEIHTDEEVFAALREVQLIGQDETESPAVVLPSGSSSNSSDTDEPSSSSSTFDSTAVESPISPTNPTAPAPTANRNIFLDLSSKVTESGNNLSQGQRQLLCLARALLRKPKIILMDEATASIDYATDAKIQETIRSWNSSSVMTIAHRLNTIVDYDRVLVLDHGKVKEYEHPWVLLQTEGSLFKDMCANSGELATLEKLAKEAWERKHPKLVDV